MAKKQQLCPTPGRRIRSKGKGKGLAFGEGKGPIGVPKRNPISREPIRTILLGALIIGSLYWLSTRSVGQKIVPEIWEIGQ